MEIILKKEQLVPTLNTVLDVVDNKTAHAIYSNVLISVLDNEIEFTGTDAESQVTIQSPFSEIKSTGTTTVNAKKFNELCRLIPDNGDISLKYVDEKLNITTDNGKYSLSTKPSSDYPVWNKEEFNNPLEINAKDLYNLINNVSYAVSNTDWREFLKGVWMYPEGEMLTAAGSDGPRIAVSRMPLNEGSLTSVGIIPKKAVNAITRFLSEKNNTVKFDITESFSLIEADNIFFQTNLLDDPNTPEPTIFNSHFPKGESDDLEIEVKGFIDAINRISVFSQSNVMHSEKAKGIQIKTTEGGVTILSRSSKPGESGEEFFPASNKGVYFDLIFNEANLRAALSRISAETFILSIFKDPGTPVIIKEPNDTNTTHLIVPQTPIDTSSPAQTKQSTES